MRFFSVFALVLTFLAGCDLGESSDRNSVEVDFALINLSGFRSVNFSIQDTFIVHFEVTNSSGRSLSYQYTGTPVVLKIMRGDTIVATSVDGLTFAQVVKGGVLEVGESLKFDWRAPNTAWRDHSIILQPGIYHAEATGGLFKTAPIAEPDPVQFTVYPGNV